MKNNPSVLIIKVGYSETLANEKGFVPSLGDVFRHTVLLHHYKSYRVVWLTSESVYPLLEGNPFIHELLTYNPDTTPQQLRRRKFDEVLCLEKTPALCNLAKQTRAGRHLGFGWTGRRVHAHPMSEEALKIANGRHNNSDCIQTLLFDMVGAEWNGEDYITGYKPQSTTDYDVGLNYLVGSKWPGKAWPMEHWRELESNCRKMGLSVTWQQGAGNLYEYMNWINSARMIITCDSLGMHLGLAFRKKVIAMFGPTPSSQIHMYGRGVILRAQADCPHIPCMQQECRHSRPCMATIAPTLVARTIARLLNIPNNRCRPTHHNTLIPETCK